MMATLAAYAAGLVPALGWTLAHFLWQGALVALALQVVLKACRTARARHDWALAALLLMAALPVATFIWLQSGVRIVLVPPGFPELAAAGAALGWERLAVAAWLTGVAILALRTAGGVVLVERLRRAAQPVPPEWAARCAALHRRMAGPLAVLFARSETIAAPIVAGWLKPMVLIPAAAFARLPADQLEALILHELAHVRRLDAFANLVQTVVEAVLFYHPAVWWVSRRIRQEREHCCDDLAVAAVRDPALYVRALQALDGLRAEPEFALAASGGDLRRRAARILGLAAGPARPELSRAAAVLILALVPVAMTAGTTVQAQPTDATVSPESVAPAPRPMREPAPVPSVPRIVLAEAAPAPSPVPTAMPALPAPAPGAPLPVRVAALAAAPEAAAAPPLSGLTVTGQAGGPKPDARFEVYGGTTRDAVSVWPTHGRGWDGRVTLSCLIDVHGLAERCDVLSETPANKQFGKAALELRPTLKLKPVEGRDGPIDSWMTIEIAFSAPDCAGGGGPSYSGYASNMSAEAYGGPGTGGSGVGGDAGGGCWSRGGFSNGLPARQVTMLDFPVWAAAPDFDDLARAYPAEGGGAEGYVAAHCHVLRTGELAGCFTIKEEPVRRGFGKAALDLTAKFRVTRELATASHPTPLWVDVPIRFAPPSAGERTVTAPTWITRFDPRKAPQVFPPEAAAQGLITGRGVARCLVGGDGSLTGCAPDPDEPDHLGFGAAAAQLASAMRMNLWSADAAPVQGGIVHVPIRLNLKPDGKATPAAPALSR